MKTNGAGSYSFSFYIDRAIVGAAYVDIGDCLGDPETDSSFVRFEWYEDNEKLPCFKPQVHIGNKVPRHDSKMHLQAKCCDEGECFVILESVCSSVV